MLRSKMILLTHMFLTCLLWNAISIPLLRAQNKKIEFQHLSLREGLSQSTVLCMTQDSRGFMWFGTRHGINRYDGYSFKVYSYSPDNPHSLSNNWVTAIFEDRSHNLWVGTQDGLNRLFLGEQKDIDDSGNQFFRYKHIRDDPNSLFNSAISHIYQDGFGRVWVATFSGLNYYDSENDTFHPFPLVDAAGMPVRAPVTAMLQDNENRLWVGTGGAGLLVLDPRYNLIDQFKTSHEMYEVRYSRTMQDALTRMTQKPPLAMIQQPGEEADIRQSFTLRKETLILAVAMGEGVRTLKDFGSIETDNQLIWLMNFADSKYAGGSVRNRLQLAGLTLPAGDYSLHYRSDKGHSFGQWHFARPDYPEFWGIRLFEITPTDLAFLQKHADSTAMDLSSNWVSSLVEDSAGDIWIGTNVTGLNKFDRETRTFKHYLGQSPFTGKALPISGVVQDRSARIWATSNSGVWRLDPQSGRAKRYFHDDRRAGSLTTDDISCVSVDRGGNIWLGTILGGINQYSYLRRKFTDFQERPSGEATPCRKLTYSFTEDRLGHVWVGTACGLHLIDPEKNRFMDMSQMPVGLRSIRAPIYSMKLDRSGALWVGTNGEGVWRFQDFAAYFERPSQQNGSDVEPDHFVFQGDQPDGLSSNLIWSILEDSGGEIWIGTKGGGLNHFDGRRDQFENLSKQQQATGIRGGWIRTIFEAQDGDLWLGTEGRGLIQYRKQVGVVRSYLSIAGDSTSLSHNSVTALYEDPEGVLWVATYGGGLNRFDRETGEFIHFTEQDGLSNNVVYGILPDEKGQLWLSTNGGLCVFDPGTKKFKTFDVRDGLQSNEFNSGAYFKSHTGDLYFGGVNGFNRVRPTEVKSNTNAPSIVITGVRVLDREVELDSAKMILSYRRNFIAFEFVGIDFTNPEKNTYAYKLAGLDENWMNCGTRRYVSYTNLAPGHYTFRVRSANNDGLWGATEASFVVIIEPPFWQTWWFFLACTLAVVGLGFFLHNYRVKAKIREVVAVERIRKKAAADFHDELGNKLTKISLFSELVKRSLDGNESEADDYLGRIAGLSNSLYDGMRDFLWTLDPGKDSVYELAIRLKDFGDEFFDKTGVDFRVRGVTRALDRVQLSMDQKRHMSLIFKEAMNNALRHAKCETVTLEFTLSERELTIAIADNGIGFNPDKICFGNGLQNILQRAEQVQSSIRVQTAPDHGCRIALVLGMDD